VIDVLTAGVTLLETVTFAVPAALVQPFAVTVSEYVPLIAVVEPVSVGFCEVLEKLFGPVQLYVAPETAAVVKLIEVPAHTGELEDAVGVVGTAFTVAVMLFEVTGEPVTPLKLEVMIHVTT
jgi:hypothetical protein